MAAPTRAWFSVAYASASGRTEADDTAIVAAWKNTLWRNDREIHLLKSVQTQRAARLVLISNTDRLRLDHALDHLDLGSLFDRQHVVASFDPGVRPTGTDNSMLTKALGILQADTLSGTVRPIFIDDVREYLVHAEEGGLGVGVVHYRSYPGLSSTCAGMEHTSRFLTLKPHNTRNGRCELV